jgi:hypothetical protein
MASRSVSCLHAIVPRVNREHRAHDVNTPQALTTALFFARRATCTAQPSGKRRRTRAPSHSDETAPAVGRERSLVAVMRTAVWCFCLLTAPAGNVAADPITTTVVITSGELVGDSFAVRTTLAGAGFTLTGFGDAIGGFWGPGNACRPCQPGAALNLDAHWSASDFRGTVEIGGQRYQMGSGDSGTAVVSVDWAASAVAPDFTGALSASIVTPFTFTGRFTYPTIPFIEPRPPVSLVGAGTATVNLGWRSEGFWILDSARYEFASASAVPEPGTLLLLGAGALSALVQERRRRQRRRGP